MPKRQERPRSTSSPSSSSSSKKMKKKKRFRLRREENDDAAVAVAEREPQKGVVVAGVTTAAAAGGGGGGGRSTRTVLPARNVVDRNNNSNSNNNNNNNNTVESCLDELEALSGIQHVVVVVPTTTTGTGNGAKKRLKTTETETTTAAATTTTTATGAAASASASAVLAEDEQGTTERRRREPFFPALWDPSLADGGGNGVGFCRRRRNDNGNGVGGRNDDDGVVVARTVREWNAAMNRWSKTGEYYGTSSPLLPCSLEVEVSRHFHVEKLSSYLIKEACPALKMPSFERWLIDSKLEETTATTRGDGLSALPVVDTTADPVLCSDPRPGSPASRRLAAEIVETGTVASDDAVAKVIKELCRRARAAVTELRAQTAQYAHKVPFKKKKKRSKSSRHSGGGGGGDRIDVEKHDRIYSLLYRSRKWTKPFCIRIAASHYNKLRELFLYVHNNPSYTEATAAAPGFSGASSATKIRFVDAASGKPTMALHAFHYIVMCLCLRYSSLSGGQLLLELRGGGMQGAIHGQVFRVLRDFFGGGEKKGKRPLPLMLEGFASPLNAYVPCFGSAFFRDLDWHFGSVGSFFDLPITEGVVEVNPPFCGGLMSAMADHMEQCIQVANETKKSLVFVVIVPTVQSKDLRDDNNSDDGRNDGSNHRMPEAKRHAQSAFQRMVTSPNCTNHIILKAREHGYIEGSQHLRLTRYKVSIFDTSVIVLQSRRSARKYDSCSDELVKQIRDAFASRHGDELDQRRGSKAPGGSSSVNGEGDDDSEEEEGDSSE